MASNIDPVREYGLTAVLSSAEQLFEEAGLKNKAAPSAIPVSATPVPDTPLARRIQAYARDHLPAPTFNHSMRVYHYGLAIKHYLFPNWSFSNETWFLTCMLHDIGSTPDNLRATRLSFEFYGGFLALDILQRDPDHPAGTAGVSPQAQAESVAEAIIRHQDECKIGNISEIGQLIQLATLFDNTGRFSELVHPDTSSDVIKNYPRLKWSGCFASTVREENSLKPWAHTTTLGDFASKIEGNPLAAEWERE